MMEELGLLERGFFRLGQVVARRPYLVSAICLVITALSTIGILTSVVIVTSPQAIWVPPGSTTGLEKAYFDEKFTPFYRIEQLFFVASHDKVDMVQKPYLHRVLAVQKEIEQGYVEFKGKNVTLDDLCFKPVAGKGCLVESPGQYWLMSHPLLANDPSVSLTAACQTTDPTLKSRSSCLDQIGTPVMPKVVLGGIGINPTVASPDPCGSTVPSAKALVITLLLNNPTDPEEVNKAKAWEKEVFLKAAERAKARLANDVQAPMKVDYLSERSIEDSLQVETSQNTWVVAVSYCCMLVYISLALGRFPHRVRSRFLVGLLGIFIVVASMAISLGLCSVMGLKTTLIIWEVIPFLILAIGVDNMFIISREFDRLRVEMATHPLEDIAGMTMAIVGPSILAAATSECLAFAVGALTNIPALQQFCTVAAVAVFADFLLQVTWFVSGLAVDAQRVDAARLDVFPCIRAEKVDDDEGHSRISDFIDRYYLPCLFSKPGRVVVWLAWIAMMVLGIYGLNTLQLGLEPQLAAPTDYYLVDYYNTEFSLGEAGPPTYVVLKDLDYADPAVTAAIRSVTTGLSFLQDFVETPIYSWIDAVQAYMVGASTECTPRPGSSFNSIVRQFLEIPIDGVCCQQYGLCGQQYVSDVRFHDDSPESPIAASRLRMQLKPLQKEKDFINSYYYLNKYVSQLAKVIPERYPGQKQESDGALAFPYSLYFVYYEQYTYIMGVAIQDVLLALAAVFLSTALITNIATAVVIVLIVLCIIINMVAIIYLWNLHGEYGVRINAVSVVNLVMGVGLSVEFVVHTASAFLSLPGTRLQRAKAALSSMGASVFSGITLTKLVGISVLAIAPSHLFRVYYFRMYTALIAMGAFEGLAFLPLFLSYFGPGQDDSVGKATRKFAGQNYVSLADN